MTEKVPIMGYKCLRCGHDWKPRGDSPPVACPACTSPYWNRERVQGVKDDVKAGVGGK